MRSIDVKVVTDATFQAEVLAKDVPTLVDFGAVYCAPCRAIAPTVEALAAEYRGRCAVATLDIDDNPLTAARYGVRSVPTLLVFRRGEVVAQLVGAVARAKIEAAIAKGLEG